METNSKLRELRQLRAQSARWERAMVSLDTLPWAGFNAILFGVAGPTIGIAVGLVTGGFAFLLARTAYDREYVSVSEALKLSDIPELLLDQGFQASALERINRPGSLTKIRAPQTLRQEIEFAA